ncbi:Hsp70 family protein [Salinibacter ruber]|uniref:Hsp70 family protein n=1 Tax=Salinibacter ruber TaxID=146919 RepID=UPI0021671DDD|nr:Hsp70 family protein [Salinibacter ruber]MCS4034446.1 molecular chaperone DnaK [Salinibacter ruber]MCS4050786.1 molecular chaperone DnaK [Salinibacter ruber]
MASIGIYFGVTTCMASVIGEGNQPRVIKDERGNEAIDAYFGIDPKTQSPCVGEKVKTTFQSTPSLAVEQIQRRMGEEVEIAFGSESIGSQKLAPEEIAAHLFRHLKRSAKARLEEEVDRCVITVPGQFSDPARRATQRAGEIAGMTVERIINEPTAAVLAYDYEERIEDGYVMVYNLGEATFDASIVKKTEDVIDVEASSRDPGLEGKDFNEALLWHVAEKFEDEHGVSIEPESGNYYRLLFECEDVRKELAHSREASAHIPYFTKKEEEPIDLHVGISRSEYEDLIGPLVAETVRPIEAVLEDGGLARSDLEDVILVGKEARDPYVESFVRHTTGVPPLTEIDPEKVVALGTAIETAIIDGETDHTIMDVCPFSLGIAEAVEAPQGSVRSGRYTEIIPANSKVLHPHTFIKKTKRRNQDSIQLRLYQRENTSDSRQAEIGGEPNEEEGFTLVADLEVEMPPGPAGQEVQFSLVYNPDGMLDIEAETLRTGMEMTFQAHAGLNESKVEQSRQKSKRDWKESEYFEDVRALLQAAEDELESGMEAEKEEQLRSLLDDIKRALAADDRKRIDALEEEITDVLFALR